jgi:hypothetical protein
MIVRESATGTEVATTYDLQAQAAAAKAKAKVETAYKAAYAAPPRNVDLFWQIMTKNCAHPRFADIALYHRPVGREKDPATGQWRDAFATNFSIRFIETAIQAWRFIDVDSDVTSENDDKVVIRVSVTDLQNVVTFSSEGTVEKTVERKEVKEGRVLRGSRQNAKGDTVYLVEATKDEMRLALGSERSKLIRDNAQKLLPRYVLDECREIIEATVTNESAKDPDSAKKKILNRFGSIGIDVPMLKEYMGGQPFESLTPDGITALIALYNGLKEGSFTWPEVMRNKAELAAESGKGEKPAPKKLRDRVLPQQQAPAQEPAQETLLAEEEPKA